MTTFTLKTDAYQTRYMYVTCTQVKNLDSNTSTINWTLTTTGGESNYYSTGPTTLTINGVTVYNIRRVDWDEYTFPAARGSKSGSLTVEHDDLGKATITVSLQTHIGYGTQQNKSGNWVLDDIPHGATIIAAPNFNDEQNPTIYYTNHAGTNADSLQACITLNQTNADIAYRDISKTGSSYTFTFTDEERQVLQQATTNGSSSRKLFFKIKTVMGENTFTDMLEVTFTVVNAKPILNPVAADTAPLTTGMTGNPNTIIKGYNSVAVAANAQAQKGAAIVSYKITNGENTLTTASGKFDYTENNTFTFSATDNRGQTTTQTVTLTMIDYVKLTCNLDAKIELVSDDNAKIIIEVSGNYFSKSFGAKANTLAIKYAIKANSGEYGQWVTVSGTPTFDGNTYKLTHEITGLVYTNSYTVKAAAYDLIGGKETSGITLRTVPVFEWGENDFNFNVPVSINNIELDYIVEQGTKDGWTYRKWNSGAGECWKNVVLTTAANTQWGSLYKGSFADRQSYPFVFAAKPAENISLQCGNYGAFVLPADGNDGLNGTYASAKYTICRPAATTSGTYYLSYYVIGKWK